MEPREYEAFTNELQQSLARDDRVIGLIAVGSMAALDTRPDRWSDHDFWLIVKPRTQEFFRSNTSWLPDASQIVFHFRETEHGVKVLYNSGHLLEYAVFDTREIHLAKANRYRILIDRQEISLLMNQVKGASHSEFPEDIYLVGQIITNVLVASCRWNRGEKLSGRAFLSSAARHLAILLTKHFADRSQSPLDNLDPLRRFEFAFPEIGMELDRALSQPVPNAGSVILDITRRELKDRINGFPDQALSAVKNALL